MWVDVVFLPELLTDSQVVERVVVVFDVLRATTSMAAALKAGVAEIRVYPSTDAAARAAGPTSPARLLCGEEKCLPPTGFDLGNSPGAFSESHRGLVVHMSTTNGTRAIVAARQAQAIYPAAIVNVGAVARALIRRRQNATILCAGTDGRVAMEDMLGAGALIDALQSAHAAMTYESDGPVIARKLFRSLRRDLRETLEATRGGQNVAAAGLSADIDYAARLDALDVVGVIAEPGAEPPVVKGL